jgi:hypothetical protein
MQKECLVPFTHDFYGVGVSSKQVNESSLAAVQARSQSSSERNSHSLFSSA